MPYSQQAFYGQTINNLTATKILGNSSGGSFSRGTSAAWTTGAASGTAVTFTSSTPSSNVTNLTATPSGPSIVVSEGGVPTTETAAVLFKPLAAGQTLTIAGLTFTAGTAGTTATQLAAAFQSIAVGTAAAAINVTKTLNDAAGGTFTAGTSAAWATGAASSGVVTFTSTTANTNVTNLSSVLAEGTSPPAFVVVEGSGGPPATNETSTVTFKALAVGQTLSLAGLTFTAGANGASATQVASAFASITAGNTASVVNNAKTLNDAAGGTFTAGTAADWSSAVANAAAVQFTSVATGNVTNLAGTLSLTASVPAITVTDGSALTSTETAAVTFQNMTAGQTLTLAGLTFTAGTSGATAEQVANAFANIALGTTSTNANSLLPLMASAYVVTPGLLTNATSLSGYIAKPDDGNIYTFLATGAFTASASTNNTTIAAIKGSITGLKTFTNGALSESISYGASVDTTLFGVTDRTVNPPTNSILTSQRSQAALQFNSFLTLLNSGSTFTGSDASNGGVDQIQGGSSNDRFTGNTGNDYFDGKAGIDTAIYRGLRTEYFIGPVTTVDRTDPLASSQIRGYTIIDNGPIGRDGIDTLVNVERLQFANAKAALDLAPTQSAGQTALLLGAVLPGQLAFDVTKKELIGSVIGLFDQNFTMAQLSGAILRLPIWDALTGIVAPTTADIATYLVHNVYGGTETAAITNAAITAMSSENKVSQGNYLASLAASTTNQTHINLVGIQAIGLEYLG
jgi:hypothetical protein